MTWAVRPAFALTIMEACLGIICASMPALKNSMQSCFHIVIDPFTYGSSTTNRRWKNPFYRSYEQSFHGYFKRSDRSNQRPNAPQNSYIGMRINCVLLWTHRLMCKALIIRNGGTNLRQRARKKYKSISPYSSP